MPSRARNTSTFLQTHWYLPVLVLYVVLLAVTLAHHERWLDEAQAWLIARDAPLWEMLARVMRYEGSPPLWHLLLALPARLHAPYAVEGLLGATSATFGVYLWLRYAPLPRWLTALMPFTYFLLYQYAVVARSYNLLLPLLAGLAILYPQRVARLPRYAGLLALLALVSTHAFFIAALLGLLLAIDVGRAWGTLAPVPRRAALLCFAGLAALAVLLAAMLKVPADHVLFTAYHLNAPATVLANALLRVNAVFLDAPWSLPFSLAVLGISIAWFAHRRVLAVFLLPFTAVLLLTSMIFYHPWHDGVLLLIWLFALWLSFQAPATPAPRLRPALLVTVALVVLVQGYWSAVAIPREIATPYSGAGAAVRYLVDHGLDTATIGGVGQYCAALQPYTARNLFVNNPNPLGGYLLWQRSTAWNIDDVLARRPRVLVLSIADRELAQSVRWDGPTVEFTPAKAYRFAGYFPGEIIWKDRTYQPHGYAVFVR
jgi:hypothetical protein